MDKLYILGCGGHARSIADIYMVSNPGNQLIFIDSNAAPGERILGSELLTNLPEDLGHLNLFIAFGDNNHRRLAFLENKDKNIVSIISSRSYVSTSAVIGRGCFVGNFCHIGPEAIIGENTIINTAAVIEHGVRIGKHTHIAPNVAISGNTNVGDNVFIGVGAKVIDKVSICDNVIVGAGSSVIHDINNPGTYVGCPVRKIK